MKKILISLGIIGVVAAVAIGGTIAYFNDVETSTNNVFTAGSLDLKVDHLKQTYNNIDCITCSVDIKSDTSNLVVAKDGSSVTPYNAVKVIWIHPRWTASINGAEWIWATDPTTTQDARNDVIYTFRKTFEWYGPITGATLDLSVGADNSYEVWLNGIKVGGDIGENNYQNPTDHYSIPQISPILQGQNTIEFKVKNWGQPNGTAKSNPGGLLYKLTIDGNCNDNYFKHY